jgi:hypothetical protein
VGVGEEGVGKEGEGEREKQEEEKAEVKVEKRRGVMVEAMGRMCRLEEMKRKKQKRN